jgi:hypothetical protein
MKRTFSFLFIFLVHTVSSQNPVNAYANVTAISGTSLSVNNVNETYHTFEDGDYVIIMQMQDNVIGSNTTNVSSFGDLGSIQSAGLFEIARIASHTEAASLPNSITLSGALVNTYNINANASVQLITFRLLGANYTTTANIGTLAWNGTVGGVTALYVTGVLTLGHTISANGSGFAGGVKNTPIGYSACDNTTYMTALALRYAGKGEGIYKRTNASFAAGRGKILNGGGGGNDVNAGGGGGGNYSAGGGGGSGWVAAGTGCSPIAGGLGGISLSASITGARVFMGGGGGGGHENDGVGTVGGAGGGIIFIKTGTLTTVTCAGIGISANGNSAAAASNDGAGGGGAGGSVIFDVNTFSVAAACPLTISANGGNGGNSNASSGGAHGGGGGGGQGAIIYSAAQPTANVTTSTSSGTGGVSCSGCSAGLNGSVGTGTANSGVVINGSGPLPVELLSFTASLNDRNEVVLNWSTAVERNSKQFILERMDGNNRIEELAGIATKGSYSSYSYTDRYPAKGINYYRLKQEDNDGVESVKYWVEISLSAEEEDVTVYPNPAGQGQGIVVQCTGLRGNMKVEVLDMESRPIYEKIFLGGGENSFIIEAAGMPPGVYVVKVSADNRIFYRKLAVSN